MPTDSFFTQTEALRVLGGQRVWSLMISLFGDLAQEPGQSIDGPVLSAIMSALNIRPEATRVALHRLRNDGWITSEKSGRISRHSLSAKGLAESAAASPRIYADPTKMAEAWQLILTPDEDPADMNDRGFAQIQPRLYVGPSTATPPKSALRFEGKEARDWLRQEAEPEALRQAYVDLLETLRKLHADLSNSGDLSPIEIAVLRCLIVHNWRRLVLKHPILPAPLVRADWPGHLCHLVVHDLLRQFPRPALDAIDQDRAAA